MTISQPRESRDRKSGQHAEKGGSGLRISSTIADCIQALFRAFRLVIVTLFLATEEKSG